MSNKDQLEDLKMPIRATSSIFDVMGYMETEVQKEAGKNVMMAKEMRPSKEQWEQLGFVFTDIPEDNVLCSATMPDGWSLKASCYPMWYDIFDENGMKRGSMVYKNVFYDRDACMYLDRRYEICRVYVTEDRTIEEIYFGNEDEKLFVAGQVYRPKDLSFEEKRAKYIERERLRAIAKQFGDENYPDWENVLAYWENAKENSHSSIKK